MFTKKAARTAKQIACVKKAVRASVDCLWNDYMVHSDRDAEIQCSVLDDWGLHELCDVYGIPEAFGAMEVAYPTLLVEERRLRSHSAGVAPVGEGGGSSSGGGSGAVGRASSAPALGRFAVDGTLDDQAEESVDVSDNVDGAPPDPIWVPKAQAQVPVAGVAQQRALLDEQFVIRMEFTDTFAGDEWLALWMHVRQALRCSPLLSCRFQVMSVCLCEYCRGFRDQGV